MAGQRERWDSRTAFIMAAVGSAIGLGNVWRFPGQAFENGGGAFFVPYFIALLTAGIPLMIVEYGIGSRYQGSAPAAYRKLDRRFEWVGWWAVMVGLIISFYYCVILAWSWQYLWDSIKAMFDGTLPWLGAGAEAGAVGTADTAEYFTKEILQSENAEKEPFGVFNLWSVLGLAATWLCVYFSIAKGVHRVGKVVMITVPLPLVILALLTLRGLTLNNSIDGLSYYLAPDWSKLSDPQVWLAAYGQVFFSLSVGWGILIAYASFRPKDSDVVNNAYMTSFANCGFSFLAGLAVFSTLGYLAASMNMPIPDLEGIQGGDLAFITYPEAIERFEMAMWLKGLLAVGFFVMLLTLGVDSAFSIVEAVSAALKDKFNISRQAVVVGLCTIGFFMGLIYCFAAGSKWLGITDSYMGNYGLALVALVQCLLVAWIIPKEKLQDLQRNINERSELRTGIVWLICLKFITPIVLILTFYFATAKMLKEDIDGAAIAFGVIPAAMVIVISFALQNIRTKREEEIGHED
ncbi:MAG: sodium-dependent transporter [Planctomycetota bacterium]|nr:sodium-dependent transporter [Planctomycetota bacterium]